MTRNGLERMVRHIPTIQSARLPSFCIRGDKAAVGVRNVRAIEDFVAGVLEHASTKFIGLSDPWERKAMMKIMIESCRQYSDVKEPKLVSKATIETAQHLHIDPNRFYTMHWSQQSQIDPGRKIFHYEHPYSMTPFVEYILKHPELGREQIVDELRKLRVAWILKSEDATLLRNGHKSRGAEWKQCYDQAQIVLVPWLAEA